jgi:hypothetical protein
VVRRPNPAVLGTSAAILSYCSLLFCCCLIECRRGSSGKQVRGRGLWCRVGSHEPGGNRTVWFVECCP